MRVEVRKIIDINQPINLRTLSPLDKVLTAIRCAFSNSNIALMNRKKREQEAHQKRLEREDYLKDILLTKVYQTLVKNSVVKEGELSEQVFITVNAEYRDILFDEFDEKGNMLHKSVLKQSDFAQYNVKFVEEEPDIRRAFPEMPYMLIFSRKEV